MLGTPLARRPHLTRSYAALELGVALLGVAMLPLLRSLDGPVGQLYRAFGGEGWRFACARVALGAGLAGLYAINTLGAVLGSVLGGFLLMPALGLLATTFVAAALNLVAASLAWINSAGERSAPGLEVEEPDAPVAPILTRGPRAGFAALFALSGFTALLLQLAWVRLFGLVLGSSVYSFSAVLGIYLLGLGLGNAAIAPLLARRAVAPWWFALIQLGIVLSAAAGIHAYAGLAGHARPRRARRTRVGRTARG